MIQKTNLSRPVWTSLLQKMEKYGIAQIKNQGVKGTHIEMAKEII
jgi:GTP-sensing pleiotropic transcriptional regulator CodY